MRVDFYGIYRPIAGGKSIEFDADCSSTVRDVLEAIIARFPFLRDELFDARGNLFAYLPIYVNGRNPRLLANGLDTRLKPEDVLSIFSPIASGKINVEDIQKPTVL
jgi:sulfur-carrier protein